MLTLNQFKSKLKKYISQVENITDNIKLLAEEVNEKYDDDELSDNTMALADNILLLLTEGEDLSSIEPNGTIDNVNDSICALEESLEDNELNEEE